MSKAICHLHRLVVTLLLVVLAAAGACTVATLVYSRTTTGALSGPNATTGVVLQYLYTGLNHEVGLHAVAILAIAAALTLAALALLWLELRTLVRSTPRLILSRGGLGEVAIHLDQIGMLAQREAEHVSGVREVQTSAQTLKTGIHVRQTIAVEPEMAMTPLAELVQQRVKQSLEFHLGFPVSRVQVVLRQTSLRKSVL